jgi:hypothetical protein
MMSKCKYIAWYCYREQKQDTTGGLAILAEIVALFAAIYAENKLFFAENVAIISAGGAEIVYP